MGFTAHWVYEMLLGVPPHQVFCSKTSLGSTICFRFWNKYLYIEGLINSMGKKTMQISTLVCPGFLSLFKRGRDLYLLPSY